MCLKRDNPQVRVDFFVSSSKKSKGLAALVEPCDAEIAQRHPKLRTPEFLRHTLECVSSGTIRKFEWILRQFKEETRRLSSAKSRIDDAEMAQKTPKLRIREFLRHTLMLWSTVRFLKTAAAFTAARHPSDEFARPPSVPI